MKPPHERLEDALAGAFQVSAAAVWVAFCFFALFVTVFLPLRACVAPAGAHCPHLAERRCADAPVGQYRACYAETLSTCLDGAP